ncbi:uncharacterized protein SCODWIG_01415 [Saccharomycodes ludwigii]|uniref:Uncharacterized protein n=1 Tax=Saccharomycodes ludwigii TaxID=36035 RepID=A0A376B598_9ASCO|nr:hypothetical protein SCDLUD_004746 [Saccharomycodes ludwigii]KAH3899309.1 hypothetical protein SCDLUD_004746 [Saccharomycodes ludwigii]SSD59654.1 uncharacterized protein SCODWIG_01415 [Saccharomycodes ludwigii]
MSYYNRAKFLTTNDNKLNTSNSSLNIKPNKNLLENDKPFNVTNSGIKKNEDYTKKQLLGCNNQETVIKKASPQKNVAMNQAGLLVDNSKPRIESSMVAHANCSSNNNKNSISSYRANAQRAGAAEPPSMERWYYSQNNMLGDYNNIFNDVNDYLDFAYQSFPSYFNPRAASNMPSKEKVVHWMESVPIYQVAENIWENDCYSVETNLDWEEVKFDEEIEDLFKTHYCSLVSQEDIIQFQCKRVDTLVKKLYALTDKTMQKYEEDNDAVYYDNNDNDFLDE